MTVGVVIIEKSKPNLEVITNALYSDGKFKLLSTGYSGKDAISLTKQFHPKVLIISSSIDDMSLENVISKIMLDTPTPTMVIESRTIDQREKRKIANYGMVDWFPAGIRNGVILISDIGLTTRCHILSKLHVEKFKDQILHVANDQQTTKLRKSLMEKSRNIETLITKNTPGTESESLEVKAAKRSRLNRVIVIGTSTGGPKLLSELLPKLPRTLPPILLIQHMPVGFTESFSERLNKTSQMLVKQAENGEQIVGGTIYIAPGGFHLEILNIDGLPKIHLTDGEMVNFVKPAVDVTLKSAAKFYGSGVISVILTGMGSDGKVGSQAVKDAGGLVIALHEKDSDIYGMNRSVIESGIADYVYRKRDLVGGIIHTLDHGRVRST